MQLINVCNLSSILTPSRQFRIFKNSHPVTGLCFIFVFNKHTIHHHSFGSFIHTLFVFLFTNSTKLNIEITLLLNEAYYKEAYTQTLKTRSSHQLLPIIAAAVVAFGFLSVFSTPLHYNNSTDIIISSLYILGGSIILCSRYYARKTWLNDRFKSKLLGQTVKMTFTDTALISTGPFTSGEMLWTGMNSIEHTNKGIILRPENGIMIYLPKSAFHSQQHIEAILSKAKAM